jgi:hypothetical protein
MPRRPNTIERRDAKSKDIGFTNQYLSSVRQPSRMGALKTPSPRLK